MMNDFLKAALTRQEDADVPEEFRPLLAQERYEQLGAAQKLIANMSTWIPRAGSAIGEAAARQVEGIASGDTPKFAVEGIGELLGGVDQALGRGIAWAGRKPLGAAGDAMDFLINHTAEAAKRYSGNKDEDWLAHSTDFMAHLVNEAATAGKKVVEPITAMGEQAAQLGEGLTAEGKKLAPEGALEGAVAGKEGRPVSSLSTVLGIEPPKKLNTLFDALAVVTPSVLGDIAQYQAAGMATAGNPIAHAVHMGGVDAFNAWYRGEDTYGVLKAGAQGIFTQNVVFASLNKLQRPLRALATAGWFGGKEAVAEGINAPEGQGWETMANQLADPVSLANMLTMTYLTAKSPGGRPVPELARDAVNFVANLPENAKVFADTAAAGLRDLRAGDPKDYLGWMYRAARTVAPNATLRVYMPKEVPETTQEDGTVIPAHTAQGWITADHLGYRIAFPMFSGEGIGPLEALMQTSGVSFRTQPDGSVSVIKGMVEPLRIDIFGQALDVVVFPASTTGEKVPGTELTKGEGVYNGYKLSNLNPWVDASGEFTGMAIPAHEREHVFRRMMTLPQLAQAVRDFGTDSGATPEEVEAFAKKLETMTFDPEGRNKISPDEKVIFDAVDESMAEAAERNYNSRAGMPHTVRNFRDFIANTLTMALPPEKSAIALQVQRALNSTADEFYRTMEQRRQAWQVAPELFTDEAMAERPIKSGPSNIVIDSVQDPDKSQRLLSAVNANPGFADRTDPAVGYGRLGAFEPENRDNMRYILPDGRIIYAFGRMDRHDHIADSLGTTVGDMLDAGAIRVTDMMSAVNPRSRIIMELNRYPTEAQRTVLSEISGWMNARKTLDIGGKRGLISTDIVGDVGGFITDWGMERGRSAWYKPALKPVAKSMASALEAIVENPKFFPGATNPDTLIATLKRGGVKENEIRWTRIPELVQIWKEKGERIPKEVLRDWVFSNAVRIIVNREGGLEALARIKNRLNDRRGDLAKALAGTMHADKASLIVDIASGGFKDIPDATRALSMQDSPSRLWENETAPRRVAAQNYIAAMGKLGITSTDQLKEVLPEQYEALEPTLQAAYTEGGAYNAYMDRLVANLSVHYDEYTQLARQNAGEPGNPPQVKDLVNGVVTVDLPDSSERSFYSLEEAKKFLSEWYAQPFEWEEQGTKGDNFHYLATKDIDGNYDDAGRRPIIRVNQGSLTGPAKYIIDVNRAPSTARTYRAHDFSTAVPGVGTVGWFRGGFINMPDGKKAYLNAEVQGDSVQNIEDHGKRELPMPSMTVDEMKAKYGQRLRTGVQKVVRLDEDKAKAVRDWFLEGKVALVPPEDFLRHKAEQGDTPENSSSLKGYKRVAPEKALFRLYKWLEEARYWETFGGVDRATHRAYRSYITDIYTRAGNIASRLDDPAVLEDDRQAKPNSLYLRNAYGDASIYAPMLDKGFTDFLQKMIPGLEIPKFVEQLQGKSDEELQNWFAKDTGEENHFMGYVEDASPSEIARRDPAQEHHWSKIVYAKTLAEAEQAMAAYFASNDRQSWLNEAVPDIPWSDEWRTQIWLESLRYAAESGADYYTWRTALHLHQEWGSTGYIFLPKSKAGEQHYEPKITGLGTTIGTDGKVSRWSEGAYAMPDDNMWARMEREQGRPALIRFLMQERDKWRKIKHLMEGGGNDQERQAALTEVHAMMNRPITVRHNLQDYWKWIPDRAERVANALGAYPNRSVNEIINSNMGTQSGYVYFQPTSEVKIVRLRSDGEHADTTFSSPLFKTVEEAQAWLDAWKRGDGKGVEYRSRWNDPFSDTSREYNYEVKESGDVFQIIRHDSEGNTEVVGERFNYDDAVKDAAEMPKSGPITEWEVSDLSVNRRSSDPEEFYTKSPEDLRTLAGRGGYKVTSLEEAMGVINKPRWGQALWKRIQANPEGGVYLPQYEGRKQNYEVVARDIMKKRIKRFGLEPVYMSTVELAADTKVKNEYRVVEVVEPPRQGFDEEEFKREITRIGPALSEELRRMNPEQLQVLEGMEVQFRAGDRGPLVTWARGIVEGAFPGMLPGEAPPTEPEKSYHIQIKGADGLWNTMKISPVDNEHEAARILEILTDNQGTRAVFSARQSESGGWVVTKHQLKTAGDGMKSLTSEAVTLNSLSETEAVAHAAELNEQVKKNNAPSSDRNKMVLGFPITPELRSDLLFNSRAKFRMGDVPAVALKPATPEELAKFKDLIDPAVTPDLVTEGKVLGINLDKVRTSEDVKRAITATKEIYEHYIDRERRGKRSHEVTVAAAKALGMSVDDLLTRSEGQAVNAEEMHAAFNLAVASARVLKEMAGYLKENPSEESSRRFAQALGLHRDIQSKFAGARAEAGRSVEILKVGASGQGQYLASIGEALTRIPGASPERVAEMISTLPTLEQTSRFVRQLEGARTSDVLLEIWINSLLSGPKSHIANIVGNLGTTFLGPIERLGAGIAGRVSGSGGVYPGESVAMMAGFYSGLLDTIRIASKAGFGQIGAGYMEARGIEPGGDPSKLDYRRGDKRAAITAEKLGLTGTVGNFVDVMGRVIRSPGTALETMDQVFKLINYRMELNALAYRTAINEGKSGAAVLDRIREILQGDDPMLMEQLRGTANEWADYQTFTKELGDAGSAVMRWSNAKPWTKLIMPFVRTPVNIFKYALDRTPGLNLLQQSMRADIMAGGVRRDMAISKIGTSAMVLAAVSALAQAGAISGAGPQDKNLRKEKEATGWLPWAVKIGDKWYSYNRLEPIGSVFGVIATTMEMWKDLPAEEVESHVLAATLAFSQAMVSKTYLKGLSDTISAITDPGANTETVVRSYLGSAIPTFMNQADMAYFDQTRREVWTRTEALMDRVPGLSSSLPPKRDAFGHPTMYPDAFGPDILSPVAMKETKPYPAMEELVKQGVSIAAPPRYVFGNRPSGIYTAPLKAEDMRDGVKLNHEQYDRLSVLRGSLAENLVMEAMGSPQYAQLSDGPDGGKAQLLRSLFLKAAGIARAQLLQEDDLLRAAVEQKLVNRAFGRRAPEPVGEVGIGP